ncbi:Putative acyl-CoA dehydrogenase AidB [Gordonia bronchialis]|nr:Putative acyl-CoA dehydrogenase AidB [Gordonia bronchialis]
MPIHQVTNQVPPLVGMNAADVPAVADLLLRSGLQDDAIDEIRALGALAGTAEIIELGDRAEAHPPILRTHDRYGHRIDGVAYDPAYHQLMDIAVRHGLHAAPWADPRPHAHLIRAAKFSVWGHVDAGHGCPISMTYAAVPALRAAPNSPRNTNPFCVHRNTAPICGRR